MTGIRTRLLTAAVQHTYARLRAIENDDPEAAEEHRRRYEQAMTGLDSLGGATE